MPICITAVEFVMSYRTDRLPHRLEAEGWISMRWMSSVDSYDLIIGGAIAFCVAIIVVAALI